MLRLLKELLRLVLSELPYLLNVLRGLWRASLSLEGHSVVAFQRVGLLVFARRRRVKDRPAALGFELERGSFLMYTSAIRLNILSLFLLFILYELANRVSHRLKIFVNRLKIFFPCSDNLIPKSIHLCAKMRDQLVYDLVQVIGTRVRRHYCLCSDELSIMIINRSIFLFISQTFFY